jgi:CBS-domain-containing membrane protein
MSYRIVAVAPQDACEDAIGIFVKTRFGALPVVNELREVVGILSETDLLRPSKFDKKVGEVMTRDVISVGIDDTIDRVIRVFQVKGVRCLPVLDGHNKLAGVIGRKDILAHYARSLPQSGQENASTAEA